MIRTDASRFHVTFEQLLGFERRQHAAAYFTHHSPPREKTKRGSAGPQSRRGGTRTNGAP
jgi:hypothetical protein